MATSPTLAIKRFYSKYKADRSDASKMVEEHWIEYGPVASLDKQLTPARVKDLKPREELSIGNPSSEQGWARWEIVERAYKMWLAGQESPLEGTPLAAWNGLSPEAAELLRSRGIKTVEEISALTDAHVERIPLPMREIIRNAKLFLEAREQHKFAAHMDEKDRQLDALKAENAEQREQITGLAGKIDQLADLIASQQAEKQEDVKPAKKQKVAA